MYLSFIVHHVSFFSSITEYFLFLVSRDNKSIEKASGKKQYSYILSLLVFSFFFIFLDVLVFKERLFAYDLKSTLYTALPKLLLIIDKQLTCMSFLSS